MSFNESTSYAKFFLDVSWGIDKRIYLEKFSFGDEFFYAEPIAVQPQFVRSPVFVYPVSKGIEANRAAQVLNDFYDHSSILPSVKIGVDVYEGKSMQTYPQYKFRQVRVKERYGGYGQRRYSFYKLEFDDWTYK